MLYALRGQTKQRVGSTECIQDSLNPEFVQAIEVDFFFEEAQQLLVEIYDADDATQI